MLICSEKKKGYPANADLHINSIDKIIKLVRIT